MSSQETIARRHLLRGAATFAALASLPLAARRGFAATGDWQDGAQPGWTDMLAAGRQEGTLVLGAPAQVEDALAKGFQRDTGIAVQTLGGLNTAHSARLESEIQAGKVTMDVLLGGAQDLEFMNHLQPLKPLLKLPQVSDSQHWRDGHIKWVDNVQTYMIQGTEYVGGWIVINRTTVDPNIASWKQLLDPKFTGRIACYDPMLPGPGQAAGSWLIDLFGADFLTQLFIGQKIVSTTDPNQLIEWIARGKYDVALGGIQVSVEQFRKQGFDDVIMPVVLKDGPGYLTGGYSCLNIPQGLPHPNAAAVFTNWFFNKPGAEIYSGIMLESSRRIDVSTDKSLGYIVPRDGVHYVDVNTQDAYQQRPTKLAALKAALKR